MDAIEMAAYGNVLRGSLQDIVEKQKIEIEKTKKDTTK